LSKSPSSLNSVCVHAGVYQTSITHQLCLLFMFKLYAIGLCTYQAMCLLRILI